MKKLSYLVILSSLFLAMSACHGTTKKANSPAKTTTTKKGKNIMIEMETNKGLIKIELFSEEAPETVKNFVKYVDDGFYNGTVFHRVIKGFMVQGGGMKEDLSKKDTLKPIKNEADNGLENEPGTIAMARTGVVDSATSQFFINVGDNKSLNHKNKSPQGYGYAVFGRVIKGMDIVKKIEQVQTSSKSGHNDVPVEPILIKAVRKI